MIIYKTTSNKWRLPRSILRKNDAGDAFIPSQYILKNDGATIAWHRNQLNAYAGFPTFHPYWQYSMNPTFNIDEGNYFNGLDSYTEVCFDTGISNPGSSGRYAAVSGFCTIYSTSSQSNGYCDCLIKPKFSLNVASGSKYRSQVTVTGRSPLGGTAGGTNSAVNARYWRFIVDAIRGGSYGDIFAPTSTQLSEFRLLGRNGNPITGTYVQYPLGGGGNPPGEGPPQAGDGSTSTKWLSADGDNTGLQIDFGSNVSVSGYRIATANDFPNRDPVSWRVQYSTNGSTWTTQSTVTGYPVTESRQTYITDFNFGPTILTGFHTNTTQDSADIFAGGVTNWSPPINFGRSVDLNDVRSPAQSVPVWSVSSSTLTWDITVDASHSWARPIIKIESTATSILPVYYTISDWQVYRIS